MDTPKGRILPLHLDDPEVEPSPETIHEEGIIQDDDQSVTTIENTADSSEKDIDFDEETIALSPRRRSICEYISSRPEPTIIALGAIAAIGGGSRSYWTCCLGSL